MSVTRLSIDLLRLDGGTQSRALINPDVAGDYADAISAGAVFPPIDVFYDGSNYWVGGGFHRVLAHQQIKLTEIRANVHQGTQQDAQWFSFSENRTHGLRRTNEDKQRAVKAALMHPLGAGKSNRRIAEHVGVDEGSVRAWREKLEATAEIPQSSKRTGSDGRTTNTANIGKRKPEPDVVITISDTASVVTSKAAKEPNAVPGEPNWDR